MNDNIIKSDDLLVNRLKFIRALRKSQMSLVKSQVFNSSSNRKWCFDAINEVIKNVVDDEFNHYVASSNIVDFITYNTSERVEKIASKAHRSTITVDKYFDSILYPKTSNKLYNDYNALYDRFINVFDKFKSIIKEDLLMSSDAFSILRGKEISEFYFNTNISSCMTNHKNAVELYSKNQDKISLVVMRNGKNILRALLWRCDDDTMVLDRIYPSGHVLIDKMLSWAKEKNYIVRQVPDRLQRGVIKLSDEGVHSVTLKTNDNIKFPYLDTFRYFDLNENYNTGCTCNIVFSNDFRNSHYMGTRTDGSAAQNCYKLCNLCAQGFKNVCDDDVVIIDNISLHKDCAEKVMIPCDKCLKKIHADYSERLGSHKVCRTCADLYVCCNVCDCFLPRENKKNYIVFHGISDEELANGYTSYRYHYCCNLCAGEVRVVNCHHCGRKFGENSAHLYSLFPSISHSLHICITCINEEPELFKICTKCNVVYKTEDIDIHMGVCCAVH